MASGYLLTVVWEGVTREQYEKIREVSKFDTDPPPGLRFHVAGFTDNALHVTDIWDSIEDNTAFSERLYAAAAVAGTQGQPAMQWAPVHFMTTPNFTVES